MPEVRQEQLQERVRLRQVSFGGGDLVRGAPSSVQSVSVKLVAG